MCPGMNRSFRAYWYRLLLVIIGMVGEILQGSLMTGWPSLSQILKNLGDYSEHCDKNAEICPSQEEHFSLCFNTAFFAINFGPVITGQLLDRFGPRFLSLTTTSINILSLLLLAHSPIYHIDTFPIATFGLGLGGFSYSMAQFYKIKLFPRYKGTISSLLNAGYQVSACGMLLVYLLWSRAGSNQWGFRLALYAYAGILGLLIPLLFWFEPDTALDVSSSRVSVQEIGSTEQDCLQPLLEESVAEVDCGTQQDQEQLQFQDYQSSSEVGTSSEERVDIQSDILQVNKNNRINSRRSSEQKAGVVLSPRWRWLNRQNFLTQITSPEAIVTRFALNSAFYSVLGSIFGFSNFGKILAVQSAITGAIGFLQYPILNFVMSAKNGSFLYVQIGQVVILLSLIPFCVKMVVWGNPSTSPPKRPNQSPDFIV